MMVDHGIELNEMEGREQMHRGSLVYMHPIT